MSSEADSSSVDPRLVSYLAELRQRYTPQRRLLLVQPPQFLFDAVNLDVIRRRGYYAYPPTGLQWLKSALAEKKDMQTAICDLNLLLLQRLVADHAFCPENWLTLLDRQLEQFQPSVVCVTGLTVYTDLFSSTHPIAATLRHLMEAGRYIVMAGGPTVSNEISGYLTSGLCHLVVDGEGEYAIRHLVEALFEEQIATPVTPNIYFSGDALKADGKSGPVIPVGNLVKSYEAIPVEQYCHAGCLNPYSRMIGQDIPYAVFQLNRGCRCNCAFCGVRPFMGPGIRTHQLAPLLEEMHYLVEKRGIRHFEALDDDLLANPLTTAAFLQGLIPLRQRYGITWAANNGLITNAITPELLELMRATGCIGFKIGIEAGSIEMLRRMKKPGTPATFKKIAVLLQQYPEFFVGGNYIIGLFGEETFGQMLATFRLAIELNLDWSTFSIFQVTNNPGSLTEKLHAMSGSATDFIPTKSIASRNLQQDSSFPLGAELFGLPHDTVPGRDLLNNIWLTFNLLANYVGNKNLKPGGDATKFVRWVEAVRVSYPENPYMCLFAGLGRVVMGDMARGLEHYAACCDLLDQSEVWSQRFERFGLDELVKNFPKNDVEVYMALERIESLCWQESSLTSKDTD